jgi:hypothetical protein
MLMIQSNRVVIIPIDGTVHLDMGAFIELDLSSCGIPADVHALQWFTTKGHIEYIEPDDDSPKPIHDDITELPDWAIKCIEQWEIASKTKSPL